jgi:alpha-D-xyloside xylohydrolase
MLRPLFLEFPDDPGSWLPEDQYLFGAGLLVAPLLTPDRTRQVYLPPGRWTDRQSGRTYDGPGWRRLTAGEIPVIALVRAGVTLPEIPVVQSTAWMDPRRH